MLFLHYKREKKKNPIKDRGQAMPLIIFTGFPASGKSTRAQQLRDYFSSNMSSKKVTILSENDIAKKKNDVHADAGKEKELRATLKSEMQRLVSQEDLLILDAGNYIKGYRYELYCIAKSYKTTQCTIHCDLAPEVAWDQNINRNADGQYSREIFDALLMRFEPPDGRNRWDSPLFTIQIEDVLPFQEISAALFERKAPTPNLSTQSLPLTSTNFLYELDCVTQEIVNRVVEAQKTAMIGDEVCIPNSSEKILLKRRYQLAELSRVRRQFISFAKTHPVDDIPRLAAMFSQYLTSNLM
uniref:Protein KTI12 homolog n=1 Tax=Eubosmina coregoni TaxID=186181 RepID=A0A4Y7LLY2_9CRUS|nr:EOG090X0A11 [Eubosmina coregoni]SVE69940.1 EOG090X0A11 [Eubosmina coregoni]